ncbi:MAG: DUF2911 domain-containing protein [Gemmatimonadota bacterium]|nr:MAG: DUF2911 domain-containing protein [Gemmatimonadota bacterium]
MRGILLVSALALAALAVTTAPDAAFGQQTELACIDQTEGRMSADVRARSPLDSVAFQLDGKPVKICYSRPSARGRVIMGGLVPYGELWRTGANEPTMIHTSVALDIAGIRVEPGTYSFYTVPGEQEWEVIVNRSIEQWGRENTYTAEVRAQEVGRATVPAGEAKEYTETFTIRAEPRQGGEAMMILEWERTRVAVPIKPAK